MANPRTILVVDDHADHLYFFRRVLGDAGYTVVESMDGDSAPAKADELLPDLVILDLVLPGKSGWEVAAEIKSGQRTSRIPVFLVTAYPHKASGQWTGEGDCDALLVKPIEPRRLLDEVARWIAKG